MKYYNSVPNYFTFVSRGGDGVVGWCEMAGNLPVLGRPTNLDYSRARRAYCACSGCGLGLFRHFSSHLSLLFSFWGWSGGAMVLGKHPVPGRPTCLDKSRARAYCSCNRCGWGLFGHFYSHLSFLFSFSLSLGDDPI